MTPSKKALAVVKPAAEQIVAMRLAKETSR